MSLSLLLFVAFLYPRLSFGQSICSLPTPISCGDPLGPMTSIAFVQTFDISSCTVSNEIHVTKVVTNYHYTSTSSINLYFKLELFIPSSLNVLGWDDYQATIATSQVAATLPIATDSVIPITFDNLDFVLGCNPRFNSGGIIGVATFPVDCDGSPTPNDCGTLPTDLGGGGYIYPASCIVSPTLETLFEYNAAPIESVFDVPRLDLPDTVRNDTRLDIDIYYSNDIQCTCDTSIENGNNDCSEDRAQILLSKTIEQPFRTDCFVSQHLDYIDIHIAYWVEPGHGLSSKTESLTLTIKTLDDLTTKDTINRVWSPSLTEGVHTDTVRFTITVNDLFIGGCGDDSLKWVLTCVACNQASFYTFGSPFVKLCYFASHMQNDLVLIDGSPTPDDDYAAFTLGTATTYTCPVDGTPCLPSDQCPTDTPSSTPTTIAPTTTPTTTAPTTSDPSTSPSDVPSSIPTTTAPTTSDPSTSPSDVPSSTPTTTYPTSTPTTADPSTPTTLNLNLSFTTPETIIDISISDSFLPLLIIPTDIFVPKNFSSPLSISDTEFNSIIHASTEHIIRRECPTCDSNYKYIYYKQLTKRTTFDAYQTMTQWMEGSTGTLGTDFNLYSTLDDALNDANAWSYCNYWGIDDGFDLTQWGGSFKDCGPTSSSTNQWCAWQTDVPGWGGRECRFSVLAPTEAPTTVTTSPTEAPTLYPTTASPTQSPTDYIIGHQVVDHIFVIPNATGTFTSGKELCKELYHDIANIYDPQENKDLLQFIDRHLEGKDAYIGYYQDKGVDDWEWKWTSGFDSDPMLWLQTPLAQITANKHLPSTNCMVMSRYGWQYSECNRSDTYVVCEKKAHEPQFTVSGAFAVNTDRKLTFDDARSLCRSRSPYKDLATIYEEEEYKVVQSMCSSSDSTNCWIGYRRGILNVNEWKWIQNIPSSVIPTNLLINVDRWAFTPWQESEVAVECQAVNNIVISYAEDGTTFSNNKSWTFTVSEGMSYDAKNVVYDSKLRFKVNVKQKEIPGLICSITFEDDTYNTIAAPSGYKYWNVNDGVDDIIAVNNTYTGYGFTPLLVLPLDEMPNAVFSSLDVGRGEFNREFHESTHHILRRECHQCDSENKDIYYKRLTSTDTFNVYDSMRLWDSDSGTLGVDFNLYSTLDDALNDANAWSYCDYWDDSSTVGLLGASFKECGPTSKSNQQFCYQYAYQIVDDPGMDENRDCRFSLYTKQENTEPTGISTDAKWIWNVHYDDENSVTDGSVTFDFSFENVKNTQNKPGDDCAAVSSFAPQKWKTNHCESQFYAICNAHDHEPVFKVSANDNFALLTDRQLTRSEAESLCNNMYGLELATIYSYYEYQEIAAMIKEYNMEDAWIGLRYDTSFYGSNNLDYKYGWDGEDTFIFDDWTQHVWSGDAFPDPPTNGDCITQTHSGSLDNWMTQECNKTSYAVCNYQSHKPTFTASQLRSFSLLENQIQNYQDGREMCRDYIDVRSTGAVIYHPIENERAIWLCSNASNDKGCFIGFNNIKYRNKTDFRWANGAKIDVFSDPWWQTPWINITTTTLDEYSADGNEYCAAILPDVNGDYGWHLAKCDDELNILCDSGDDHAQCWMLQSCSECAIRSDCGWCGNQCQLTDEICYASDTLIYEEFSCDDYDPIINITYKQNQKYLFEVNITMCTQAVSQSIATDELYQYVNHSHCVLQEELIEFYITSDWKAASYGNYEILGKVLQVTQIIHGKFDNTTSFAGHPPCDIRVVEGYVANVTCQKAGAGHQNNMTQFDMLQDVLRYLLPRLEKRLFAGFDIGQDSLFGYTTMNREYDYNSNDHSIHQQMSKKHLISERYANTTTDLLWDHRHTVEAGNTIVKHMDFVMIHVFATMPHHETANEKQIFTWVNYEIDLVNETQFTTQQLDELKDTLYNLNTDDIYTKMYTMEEWRGIRPGNFMFEFKTKQDEENEERRRLGAIEEIKEFCTKYNKYTNFGGERVFELWGMKLWVSQIVGAKKADIPFLKLLASVANDGFDPLVQQKTWKIVGDLIGIDLGFEISLGLGWNFVPKESPTPAPVLSPTSFTPCPISFKIQKALFTAFKSTGKALQTGKPITRTLNQDTKLKIIKCCVKFREVERDCSKTQSDANEAGNTCMIEQGIKGFGVVQAVSRLPIFSWQAYYTPPTAYGLIEFIMLLVHSGSELAEDIGHMFTTYVTTDQNVTESFAGEAIGDTIKLVLDLLEIGSEAGYLWQKHFGCSADTADAGFPLAMFLDIRFDFGLLFGTRGISDICSLFKSFTSAKSDEDEDERRRRLSMLFAEYPIIKLPKLPCIPISPPLLMLCPSLEVATRFGLEIEPDLSEGEIGIEVAPAVGFDLEAAMSLTIGIVILNAQIRMGVRLYFVLLEFPFDLGLKFDPFGVFGSTGIDLKVLDVHIFLEFRLCAGIWVFKVCFQTTLWSFDIIAWEYKKTFAEFGMGSYAHKSAIPANADDAVTVLRFYWAFYDTENTEFYYDWKQENFDAGGFNDFDLWIKEIIPIDGCNIDKSGSSVTTTWYQDLTTEANKNVRNITDPFVCQYNLDGFQKALVTELTIKWYSTIGMHTCFQAFVKKMFDESLCCDMGVETHEIIQKKTGIKFDISSFKMIIVDVDSTWYTDKCVQYFLNVKVQIDHTPYYDDCSDEGWKISTDIEGTYTFGNHDILGQHSLVHYDKEATCLNWFNSSLAVKATRNFEITFGYDLLMIGLRFWAKTGSNHNSDHWYGLRFLNESNYYWISNVNSSCLPTEEGYAVWRHVSDGIITDLADVSQYCYTDVLVYIDPFHENGKHYKFDLEIIADVGEEESWGFSGLTMNTFDNEDICVKGIDPIIEIQTELTSLTYTYYGTKDIPSIYYGYLLFHISFDYRFHDISSLISLSFNNLNDESSEHFVINFDNEQSGMWIRSGTGSLPSDGILTLNGDLSSTVIDTDSNDDRVYTEMYIQWDASSDENFIRIGWGHVFGENIIATMLYDKFKISNDKPIQYIGFARGLGESLTGVYTYWKVYTNNLPSECFVRAEEEVIHESRNYKQTCTGNQKDPKGDSHLIVYDLVTPNCIYYTNDFSNVLQYSFSINDAHNYVTMSAGVFATFAISNTTSPTGWCETEGTNYAFADYAVDGGRFNDLHRDWKGNKWYFTLTDANHKSKVRFRIINKQNVGGVAYLQCSILISGASYGTTAADISHWSIVAATDGNLNGGVPFADYQGHPNHYWNSNTDSNPLDYSVTFQFSFANVAGQVDINIDGQVTTNIDKVVPDWQPNINSAACQSIDYFDGISDHFSTNCHGTVEATFEHLSTEVPFKIEVSAGGVTDFGISDITLVYGTCNDVLPLVRTVVRYDDTAYTDISNSKLHSISSTSGYLIGMAMSQLDDYVSSESYIYIGTKNMSEPRWIVRFVTDTVEVWISTGTDGLFGASMVSSKQVSSSTSNIINNNDWFNFYISWDQTANYFRVGSEFIVNESPLIDLKFQTLYADKGVVIDSIGIMHGNKLNKVDWNVITFQFIPSTEPMLCWTSQLQLVGRKSWINTEMETIWLTQNDEPTPRIPTTLTSSLVFNGPFASGEYITKTFVSLYQHDYIIIQARLYGFGEWDVLYPTFLNGLSVYINNNDDDDDVLIWFGTYLEDGGSTAIKCNISEYKQWFSWTELESTGKIPIDILSTDTSCYYDLNIYLKHNDTNEPFTISFSGDLQETVCDVEAQFDIMLKDIEGSVLTDYPKKLSGSDLNYKNCYALCNDEYQCKAWMYNDTGYCWLMTTSDLNIERVNQYTSGICDGEHIYDQNSSCVCDNCQTGNEYYYLYIESQTDLSASFFKDKTLYSQSCDFSLFFVESDNTFTIKNLKTKNVINMISLSDIDDLVHNVNNTWTYPIRMILDGPVLSIVDDTLENYQFYQKQCVIQHDMPELMLNYSIDKTSTFYMTDSFSLRFSLDIPTGYTPKDYNVMTLTNSGDSHFYFVFGWTSRAIYFYLDHVKYDVTDTDIKDLATAGETLYTFKYDGEKEKAFLWANGQKNGYQSFSNVTFSNAGAEAVFHIAGVDWFDWVTNWQMTISQICVSDLSYVPFKDNSADFDYGMRCWSGKYKNINRHDSFVTSFVSDAGCGSVVSSCHVRYGEDLDYISYYDEMSSEKIPNDLDCYAGKFSDPTAPRIHNDLCVMFKKCESPKQSLYTKSWAFSGVNVTTAICDSTTPNITRKISIQYKDQFEIDDGTVTLTADDVYTINNGFIIFRLQPFRYPNQGFDNRSVYISLMNSERIHGQEEANVTWTFELNNEFGIKFYRGNRTGTQRLISSRYIENILSAQDSNYVAGYCSGDNLQNDINITYSSDGKTFEYINSTKNDNGIYSFTLQDISYVSKIHFDVESGALSQASALICSIHVRGEVYSTSSDEAFWTIYNSKTGGHSIVEKEQYVNSNSTVPDIDSDGMITDDAKWIWNFECESNCADERIVFEFSFFNVDNADNEASFYVEWDAIYGDYIRFGFYNKSKYGISYTDNSDLILEVGYISNLYTHAIYADGHFGNNSKIYIDEIMFSIANDSYNLNSAWWVLINILNTTNPKPCFAYDITTDQQTRITQRDLDSFSLWKDDGRSMNWKSNGNTLPDWHKIQYLNWTDNSTQNRYSFPYYFHYPFTSKQKTWRRSFDIDTDITYDYTNIEFDIFTFCGWNHETDSVSVSLAFEEYLNFAQFWSSTHTHYECEGYNSPTWNTVIDVVRMNNDTHNDLSCYVKGMSDPVYECDFRYVSYEVKDELMEENVITAIYCEAFGANSLITVRYYADGKTPDSSPPPPFNKGAFEYWNATRTSRYTFYVENKDLSDNEIGGLMCNISVAKNGVQVGGLNHDKYAWFRSNTSSEYWSIISSSDGNTDIDYRNSSDRYSDDDEAKWIWNGKSGASFVEFQFDFANVFISEYNLSYVNDHTINISNITNITQIEFEATALTQCKLTFNSNGVNISDITITDGEYISSFTNSELQKFIGVKQLDYIYIDLQDFEYECRLDLYSECEFNGDLSRLTVNEAHSVNIIGNASSWRFYAARGKQCLVRFKSATSTASWSLEVEDGGMRYNECNAYSISSVNITVIEAHYGCYSHVSFEVPKTDAPFVLQISAQIDDTSYSKLGSFKKSWGFGNVTITPLQCSNFSNIVPLKSPITLTAESSTVQLSQDDLFSFEHNYLFMLLNSANVFDLNIVFGDSATESDVYFWNISLTESKCTLQNIKISKSVDCSDNTYFKELINKLVDTSVEEPQLIWFQWDPFGIYTDAKQFSFGIGDSFEDGVIASEDIYGDDLFGVHYNLDYVTFIPSKSVNTHVSIAVIQLDAPKICLSKVAQLNNDINLGNLWIDDCNKAGWEWTPYGHILNDTIYIDNQSYFSESFVTELSSSSNCFYGPFKGSEPLDFGDYISRYFYIFGAVEHDIITVHLDYHSLCTWNPEHYENDTAYVFINNDAIWKSASQYEFVEEYCSGYDLYDSWTLDLDYFSILNPDLISCLHLLDEICSYPVSFTFRYSTDEIQSYFRIGLGAKLNQKIDNEAFGFSNVRIEYESCPDMKQETIGKLHTEPVFAQYIDEAFGDGDLLINQNTSRYYVVTDSDCTFTLFGGYKMWSQHSSDCTIRNLPMFLYVDWGETYDLELSIDGVLSLIDSNTKSNAYSQRTPCIDPQAYYYYSMNMTDVLSEQWSLYSIGCDWHLAVNLNGGGPVKVVSGVMEPYTLKWSHGTDVKSFEFNSNGYLVVNEHSGTSDIVSSHFADFMIFNGGKLILIDHYNSGIVQQFDFNKAECDDYVNTDIIIKYFYFMKPGDILWNGEGLISSNCEYKLILQNGKLEILNSSNAAIWTANPTKNGERFEFLRDGSMVLYSYSNDNDVIWTTDTSTLLERNNIFYADRAILNDDGQFFIIDNASLTVHFSIPSDASVMTSIETAIQSLYDESLSCDSSKYEYVNKEYGFYASWISYYNCDDNLYRKGETTECVAFKYCPTVKHYENVFLDSKNCKQYYSDEWRSFTNDYLLFQVSVNGSRFTNVMDLDPTLYIVLSNNDELVFGDEFADNSRTLLITIDFAANSLQLKTKNGWETLKFAKTLFDNNEGTEWLWIQWNINFNYIGIGNSEYISSQNAIFVTEYSGLFDDKLNRNKDLFSTFNLAWRVVEENHASSLRCPGYLVVQLSPLNVDIPKGCFANESTTYSPPMNTVLSTSVPTMPTTPPTTVTPSVSPSPPNVLGTDIAPAPTSTPTAFPTEAADGTKRRNAKQLICVFMILYSLFALF